jgi:stage II sporulation protein D
MNAIRVVAAICVLLLGTIASARDVKVRLYSATPPGEITLTPREATWKTCNACQPQKITKQISIRAAGNRIVVDGRSVPDIYVAGAYDLRSTNRGSLELRTPLRVRAVGEKLVLIATMPLEEYVAAVVSGEAGGIRLDEALKAAAVAARTYAVRFSGRHKLEGFELCDSTHCQNARFGAGDERARSAVAQTAGELLWYRGSPAASYYSRNCGGRTEDASEVWPDMHAAYLSAHTDPYCNGADDSTWESTISRDEMANVLALLPHAPASARSLGIESRTASGRNRRLHITSSDGRSYLVDEQTFRFAAGRALGWNRIRSDQYDVQNTSTGFRFAGRGAGHGIGMCQRGAAVMGQQGKSYRGILAFYYPGTRVGLTAQGLPWAFSRGERGEMFSIVAEDAQVLEAAERAIPALEGVAGLQFTTRLQFRVYPSVETFRDATGEPGWVAASTRGSVIRLQPANVLRQRGTLETTLRHELLHVLIESHAKPGTPLWFREGLVLHLSGARPSSQSARAIVPELLERRLASPRSEIEMRAAYGEALRRTRALISQHGQQVVLSWLEKGVPAVVASGEQPRR